MIYSLLWLAYIALGLTIIKDSFLSMDTKMPTEVIDDYKDL